MDEYRGRAGFYIRYVLYIALGLLVSLAVALLIGGINADWARIALAGLSGAAIATATMRAIRRGQ